MRENLSVVARRSEPHDSLDYFPTPPWATRAFMDAMKDYISASDVIWEPACGEGHMACVLAETCTVIPSDIFDYGYGAENDFFDDSFADCDWIITNPPFNKAEEFAREGVTRAKYGVALLVRLSWLESASRHKLFNKHPPANILIYSGRVPMHKGRWEPNGSTATAYCWVVWRKNSGGVTAVNWIRPDAKKAFSKPEDAVRFGTKTVSPLFPEAGR